jgi:hypothetical protein
LQIRNFLSGCFLISGGNLGSETKLKFGSYPKQTVLNVVCLRFYIR